VGILSDQRRAIRLNRKDDMTETERGLDEKVATYGSPAYRWYVLGVMILVYSCHAMIARCRAS